MRLGTCFFAAMTSCFLIGCGGGSGGGGANATCGPEAPGLINISGAITYDLIPITAEGLDYNDIQSAPVRGATVEIRYNSGTLLGTTKTDSNGQYDIEAPLNQNLQVRALAELSSADDDSYDISVRDNTSGNAMYVLSGSIICSGTEDSVRDLHAPSGWGEDSYTTTRTAAPFAILDSTYQALNAILSADPDVQLPAVQLRWSTENRAVAGNRSNGEIGTSSYAVNEGVIYILGHEDNDTDEYDRSVVQHEFTHYIEDAISRSDSIGGSHSIQGRHDMRLAYSEGLANAFSGIFSGNEFYRDSGGPEQSQLGANFSLENNAFSVLGWFNENSVGKIIYDAFDATNEIGDDITTGFAPILATISDTDFQLSEAQVSIYLFAEVLSTYLNASDTTNFEQLLSNENIEGRGLYGVGESNIGFSDVSLPIYTEMDTGDTVNLCSNEDGGSYNGIGVRRFIKLNITQNDSYTIEALKTSSADNKDTDPDFRLYSMDENIATFQSGAIDIEIGVQELQTGTYVVEFYDFDNVSEDIDGGISCFDVSVTQNGT
ncbi:MAG: hypothetical protein K6L76_11505 [Agarilytica sp.]